MSLRLTPAPFAAGPTIDDDDPGLWAPCCPAMTEGRVVTSLYSASSLLAMRAFTLCLCVCVCVRVRRESNREIGRTTHKDAQDDTEGRDREKG